MINKNKKKLRKFKEKIKDHRLRRERLAEKFIEKI